MCVCFKMCLSDRRGLPREWNSSVVFVQKGTATAALFPWSTAHLYILTHMLWDIHSRNVDAISYPASYLYQSLWPSAQGTIIPGHSAFGMLVTVALVGGDVARQWTLETALSRCCWLSQAASSPTRRNTTLSFLKCVTASGVLETAGNNSHTWTWTHRHAHARTLTWQNFIVEHNRCCIPALWKLGWSDFVQVKNFPKVCLKLWKYMRQYYLGHFFSVLLSCHCLSFRLKRVMFCHIYNLFKANSVSFLYSVYTYKF